MADDAQRRAILRRRASFIASSLAALSCGAGETPTSAPPVPTTEVSATGAPFASASASASASAPASASVAVPAPSVAPTVARVCLSIRIMPKVQFDHGSLVPTVASHDVLKEAAKILHENPRFRLMIEGHTDTTEPPYGRKVGLKRAKAVRAYFVKEGIDPARLCTQGFGDSRPLTASKTPKDRATNRRVEFRILRDDETCP